MAASHETEARGEGADERRPEQIPRRIDPSGLDHNGRT